MAGFGRVPDGRGQRIPQTPFSPPPFNNRSQFNNSNMRNEYRQITESYHSSIVQSEPRGRSSENLFAHSNVSANVFLDTNSNSSTMNTQPSNIRLPPPFVENRNYEQMTHYPPAAGNMSNLHSFRPMQNKDHQLACSSGMQPPRFEFHQNVPRPHGTSDLRFTPPRMPTQNIGSQPMSNPNMRMQIQSNNNFCPGPVPNFEQVTTQNAPFQMNTYGHQKPPINEATDLMQTNKNIPNQDGAIDEHHFTKNSRSLFQENSARTSINLLSNVETKQCPESNTIARMDQRKDHEQMWINEWLKKIGKSKTQKGLKDKESVQKTLKISDAQGRLKKVIFLMAKLRQQASLLQGYVSREEDEPWKTQAESAINIMKELEDHKQILNDPDRMRDLQQRVKKRRNKRLRQKRKRMQLHEEKLAEEEERATKHAEIDKWQAKIHQEHLNLKQEKEMKAAADSTLSEVRKKIADVNKTVDLLKGLQKLRKLRKQRLENQGVRVNLGSDKDFELKIAEQMEAMSAQRDVYLAEEKALKVMLEVEHEETKEREREKSLRIKLQQQEKLKKRSDLRLFGAKVELEEDDPLLPFHQYYDQANHNLEAFLQIRREWDRFLVPKHTPGGSRFPDGFVVPAVPSSDHWAKVLQDQ